MTTTAVSDTPAAMTSAAFPDTVRVDARDKVRGATRYGTDRVSPGMLHAALAVATIARGAIDRLDTAAATAVPGVRLVLSHRNIGSLKSAGFLLGGGYAFQSFQPMLTPRIAYRGQPIALVVADTLEAAGEAAALVTASYDEEPFAPTIDSPGAESVAQATAELHYPSPDTVVGDAEAAYAQAAVRIDRVFRSPAQHQNPIELIGTVAQWQDGRLIIHEGTQNAGALRFGLAQQLGIAAERITVISPSVGGGFGQKNSLQMQTAIVALAALQLGSPVKLVVPRAQLFHDASFRPASRQRVRLAADASGKMVAALHEVDAQTSRHDLFPGEYTQLSSRLYGIDHFRGEHRLVRTDTQTPGYMRAPFEHPACFAMESCVDELAYALGQDPVALRLANDTRTDPVTGLPLSSRHMGQCLRRGAQRFGWSARQMAPTSMRAADGAYIGWGVACGAYPASTGPNVARLLASSDGSVVISVGVHEMGQGIRTALANVVGRKLGVPPQSVVAVIGDTRGAPQHLTAGSWGTATAVPAAEAAADAMLQKLAALAPSAPPGATPAEKLRLAGRRDLEVEIGRLAPGQPEAAMQRLHAGRAAPAGPDYPGFVSYSYIAHFVEVRVEPGTRRVRIPRVVSVADCGRVASPRTAASQVRGGVIWGIGAALREVSEVDERYGGFLNADIAEYMIPVNADIGTIEVDFIDEPDPLLNAAGVKGLGEVVMVGVAPAIANAIYHATGKRLYELPFRVEDLL